MLSKGKIINKEFWKKIKPALTESNPTKNNNITLKEGEHLISDNDEISKILNDQYVNIVENSTGSAPTTLGNFDVSDTVSMKDYVR